MIRKHRALITSIGVLAALASFAALAWACTPQARLTTAGPSSGPAGSSVTLTGTQFVNGDVGNVEITWSASGGGGKVALGTATGPDFSTTVTVPDAPPGIYYFTATSTARDASGNPVGSASRAFDLTAAAPPAEAPPASATPQPDATAPPSSRTTTGRERAARRGDGGERQSGPSRKAAPRAGATPNVTTRSGVRVFEGSVAGASRSERSSAPGTSNAKERGDSAKTAAKSTRSDRAPSSRNASDLPSLTSSAGSTALDDGPGSQLGIGVALLALGLVAPLAGFLVAEVRRRRAQVPTRQR